MKIKSFEGFFFFCRIIMCHERIPLNHTIFRLIIIRIEYTKISFKAYHT